MNGQFIDMRTVDADPLQIRFNVFYDGEQSEAEWIQSSVWEDVSEWE